MFGAQGLLLIIMPAFSLAIASVFVAFFIAMPQTIRRAKKAGGPLGFRDLAPAILRNWGRKSLFIAVIFSPLAILWIALIVFTLSDL